MTAYASVPVCLYDNPATTRFAFTDVLYAELVRLPGVHLARCRRRPVSARERMGHLDGLWHLFARFGSVRVMAAAAAQLGLTRADNLPRPLRPLDAAAQRELTGSSPGCRGPSTGPGGWGQVSRRCRSTSSPCIRPVRSKP